MLLIYHGSTRRDVFLWYSLQILPLQLLSPVDDQEDLFHMNYKRKTIKCDSNMDAEGEGTNSDELISRRNS